MEISFSGQFESPSDKPLSFGDISVNRHFQHKSSQILKFLNEFIDFKKTTLVIGDFNACPERKPNNEVSSFFSRPKFNQLVTLPTHIDGGAFLFIKTMQTKFAQMPTIL